jgi:hypothetical protein
MRTIHHPGPFSVLVELVTDVEFTQRLSSTFSPTINFAGIRPWVLYVPSVANREASAMSSVREAPSQQTIPPNHKLRQNLVLTR